MPGQLPRANCLKKHRRARRDASADIKRCNAPAQAGESKERTFESTFVITLRKPRRKAKSGAPQSKKASSLAPTDKTRKRKPAKASRNGKTTTVRRTTPKTLSLNS